MISEKLSELLDKYIDEIRLTEQRSPRSTVESFSKAELELYEALALLESENARLLQARRWIPVGERLPEEAGWYLAKVENKTTFTFRSYETVYFANGKFHSNVTNDQMDFMTITHWRILPELQEEVDG